MSRSPKHCYNTYTRRILCQRCHRSPAKFQILGHIRLCSKCSLATFPKLHQLSLPKEGSKPKEVVR